MHNFFPKFSCHNWKYNIKFRAPRFIIIIYDWFAMQCKKDLLVQDPSNTWKLMSTYTCSATKLWHWVLAWSFSKDNHRLSLLKPFKFLLQRRPHTGPECITLVYTNSVMLVIQAICIFTALGAVSSFCKKQQKTFSFTVSWQKQVELYVSSQKGELFKLSTFSFTPLMLKLRKWFDMFENTVKICCLNSPVNKSDHFVSIC